MNPLSDFRCLLKESALDAYIIPTGDAHRSDNVAECDKRLQFISGFTGSSGTAVVTENRAALWTDGRYWLQASNQLSDEWKLMKDGDARTPSIEKWLQEILEPCASIGVDPIVVARDDASSLKKAIEAFGGKLCYTERNLVDLVWKDRPSRPANPLRIQPLSVVGTSLPQKLMQIREKLQDKKADFLTICALDSIAWLFNLRGNDLPFTPVFFSFALVGSTSVHLFVSSEHLVDDAVRQHLSEIEVRPYEDFFSVLKHLSQNSIVWCDPHEASSAVFDCIPGESVILEPSPIFLAKSLKNESELEGMRLCHKWDGAAMVRLLSWMARAMEDYEPVSEFVVGEMASTFRAKNPDYLGPSFAPIVGSGCNAAIVHYRPTCNTCSRVDKDAIVLLDSGGQYRNGTTDITRTVHYGTPTAEEVRAFTLVLKGHISLARVVFPRDTTGHVLDSIARTAMWRHGLDYRHGTGHGVGANLCVHEGPQYISGRCSTVRTPLAEGMTITIEPGYYSAGRFGIRIENLAVVTRYHISNSLEPDNEFLQFEVISFAPIQTKLIDMGLLTQEEKDWLNEYHKKCREQLLPFLKDDSAAQEWLLKETAAVE